MREREREGAVRRVDQEECGVYICRKGDDVIRGELLENDDIARRRVQIFK